MPRPSPEELAPADPAVEARLAAVRAGRDALNELFETLKEELDRAAAGLLRRRGSPAAFSASDLVNETAAAALKGLHKFRGHTRPELQAWLHRIMRRRMGSLLQARANRGPVLPAAEDRPDSPDRPAPPSPGSEAADHERQDPARLARLKDTLTRALQTLVPDDRLLFLLRVRCGLGFREIGLYLDCEEDAARKRLAGVVERLQRDERLRRLHDAH
jgi:RNA polymerase sigma factor (sigma-70 family)